MQKSSDSLMKLINDLLDFSKLDSATAKLSIKPENIREIVSDVHRLLLPIAINKSLKLEVSFDENVPEVVNIDEVRLRQTLLHLISNALKFTSSGSVQVKVSVSPIDKTKNELIFQIIDTGAGIADAIKDKLFEDFYQADSSIERKYEGTGMGLSLVKKIVKLMQGKVGVESVLGQGSIFWFSLPIENSIQTDKPKAEEQKILSFPPNIQALLIEENPMTQELLMSMLTKAGLKSIVVVQTRLQGLEKIKNHYYDLAILNISQKVNGQLTGLELVKELRKVGGQNPDMIIMGLTKDMDENDNNSAQLAGVTSYMHQPLNRQQVSLAIQSLIDGGHIKNATEKVA
jgi:CheY-like chemotaxis protein/two-component sensor histidine kinase